MLAKRFALEKGGRPRLLVRWSRDWSEVRVFLDGAEIGGVEGGRQALGRSPPIDMPEGAPIRLRLATALAHDTVAVHRSGAPLPVNDPHARLRGMGAFLMVSGAAAIVFGAIGVLASPATKPPTVPALALAAGAFGLVYLPLGYAVRRWCSAVALGIACGLVVPLVAADWLTRSSYEAIDAAQGIVLTVAALLMMWRGLTAIGDAKELDRNEPQHATDSR